MTATALMARSMACLPRHAPSQSTIARVLPRPLGAAALLGIAMTHMEPNGDDTQHWPEPLARTSAPWHTRTVYPPRLPTSAGHWKAPRRGRASTHDDENGHAACSMMSAVRAVCAGVRDRLHVGRLAPSCGVRASVSALSMREPGRAASPRPIRSVPLPKTTPQPSPVRHPRVNCASAVVMLGPTVTGAANASPVNLGGSIAQEALAHVVLTELRQAAGMRPTVVRVAASKFTASRNPETPTIAFIPFGGCSRVSASGNPVGSRHRDAFTSPRLLLRAAADVGARVHDGVKGSRTSEA